jgi:hypothetical protein
MELNSPRTIGLISCVYGLNGILPFFRLQNLIAREGGERRREGVRNVHACHALHYSLARSLAHFLPLPILPISSPFCFSPLNPPLLLVL